MEKIFGLISLEEQRLNMYSLDNLQVTDIVSEQVSTFFNKLNKLDLQPVAKKLMSFNNGHGWTTQQTELAISLYKMFLCLHFLFPNIELVPTQEIDEVWHTHILLNTYQYIQDCQKLFGYILHHYSPVDETSSPYQQTVKEVTKLLLEFFGVSILKNSQDQLAAYLILPLYNRSLRRSACMTIPKI